MPSFRDRERDEAEAQAKKTAAQREELKKRAAKRAKERAKAGLGATTSATGNTMAPEAPEVFFAVKRNGATTKQTSGSVQPPSRKRRKPLLDISRNARGDATSRETERNGNGAKRNARPAKKTAVSR